MLQESSYIVLAPNPVVTWSQALGLRLFFFATIHKNGGFGNRSTEISNYKDFQKGATMNTGCDVKKQRSRSEMSASPIYHLNHSRMRFVKLLKLRPLNILREVQWSQMSVKMLLKSQIEARSSSRDLIRKIKCLHYSTVKKKNQYGDLNSGAYKSFLSGFWTYQSKCTILIYSFH